MRTSKPCTYLDKIAHPVSKSVVDECLVANCNWQWEGGIGGRMQILTRGCQRFGWLVEKPRPKMEPSSHITVLKQVQVSHAAVGPCLLTERMSKQMTPVCLRLSSGIRQGRTIKWGGNGSLRAYSISIMSARPLFVVAGVGNSSGASLVARLLLYCITLIDRYRHWRCLCVRITLISSVSFISIKVTTLH